jgi:outer membrane protein assembly factor BamA
MQGQAVATIRNQLGNFNFTNATNTLWNTAAALSGDIKYIQPPYRPAQAFTDYQDYVAQGYEFSLTANPTANWRVSFNAGAQENQQSNIGPVLKKYWAEYEPLFRAFPSRDLNGNGVIDATLPTTPHPQNPKTP